VGRNHLATLRGGRNVGGKGSKTLADEGPWRTGPADTLKYPCSGEVAGRREEMGEVTHREKVGKTRRV